MKNHLEYLGRLLSRWSVQVTAVQFIILSAMGIMGAPLYVVLPFALLCCAVALAASYFPQNNVRTYDPRKCGTYDLLTQRIAPIEEDGHGGE